VNNRGSPRALYIPPCHSPALPAATDAQTSAYLPTHVHAEHLNNLFSGIVTVHDMPPSPCKNVVAIGIES